ncbi:MAG: Gfo/Idh/MocA family oxidoreductase [Desulfobacteraceae bacterium]
MLNIGVIGCGYWGPNLIRNFNQLNTCDVLIVADLSQDRLSHMKMLYPGIEITKDYSMIINNPDIHAVAIATPVHTHYKFASEALYAGKHIFVEKPLTASVEEAESLVALADQFNRKLMVGHISEYTCAVRKMKEVIDSGELGEIYYINSQRLNLGLFQKDINVVWDLAPHDIAIVLYLLGQEPEAVSTMGASHVNPSIEDVAVLAMHFPGDLIALIQTSWLAPDKVHKTTVVGSRKMMVYDDTQPSEKIRIYDKGVEMLKHYDSFAESHYSYKYGDIVIHRIDGEEPLRTELSHFVDAIRRDINPLSDGRSGLRVVKILEAAQRSLELGNNRVLIGEEAVDSPRESFA